MCQVYTLLSAFSLPVNEIKDYISPKSASKRKAETLFHVVRVGVRSVVINSRQYVSRKSLAWDLAVFIFQVSLEMPSPSQFSFTPCEQKMPSLRSLPRAAEVWAGWISFTQQHLDYRDGASRSKVWTATILVCFRSSDPTSAVCPRLPRRLL